MTRRWLTPEDALTIGQKNREAWGQKRFLAPRDAGVVPGPKHRSKKKVGRELQKGDNCPSETQECMVFIAWTKLVTFQGDRLFERVIKIPNERGKSGVQTAILTGIGMRAGFPDYLIEAPAGRWHGLRLEAKRVRGGKTDADQLAWRQKLTRWGYHAEICHGADELIQATRRYFTEAGCVADGSWIDRTI